MNLETDGEFLGGKLKKRKNVSMKKRDKKRRMLPLIQGC